MKSMFFIPEHRVFDYKPLYYDPEKERRERRRRELAAREGRDLPDDDPDGHSDNSAARPVGSLLRSGAMRREHTRFMQEMEGDQRKQKVRTITLIVILAVVAFLFLNGSLDALIRLVSGPEHPATIFE